MKQGKQKDNSISLSQRTKEVILGSLLGDGSLKIHRGYRNARFSFRHSIVQKEYFNWKTKELEEISGKRYWWIQEPDGKSKNEMLRYQSLALPCLTEIYRNICRKKKFEVQRQWLNQLTSLSLAVWWMDDGSIIGSGRQGVFSTNCFSYREQLILSQYLKEVWDVNIRVGRQSDKYRLYLYSSENLKKFLRIILPYVSVKYMVPKILLLYKDSLLQQRWISEVLKLTNFSEYLITKYLMEKKQRWKNFRE